MERKKINSFLELDWTKKPYIFVLIISFILSRIPLLNLGFGSDSDAWRIANSAFDLHFFHFYHPSRFPGYPLPEIVNSIIINHSWLATNSLTMILSLISVIFFAKILKELNVKNKGLLVVTYAFLPIIWINSANTMDYMWALTFIILSWYLIIKNQYIVAGLMMGLAIGSRPTSAIFILPFLYLILTKGYKIKNILHFVVTTVITASVLFLPLYLQYGTKFLTQYPSAVNLALIWSDISYYFGTVAIIIGIIFLIFSMKDLSRNTLKDREIIFSIFTILLLCILFMGAPSDIAYLIPAIPFVLLILDKILKKEFLIILCALLILNSFLSFNITSQTIDNGAIGVEIEKRDQLVTYMEKLTESNIKNSVIISGEYLPVLSYLAKASNKNNKIIVESGDFILDNNYWNLENNIGYVYLAPLERIKILQKRGYTVYFIGQTTLELTKSVYGYDLRDYNCSNVDVLLEGS